jgi:ribosomal protein S18 acetylase RimI-like enzyme
LHRFVYHARSSFRNTAAFMTTHIRTATPADLATIVEFNRRLAAETESKTLDPERLTLGVQAALEHAAYGQYYLAERDREIAGQLLITYEWSDWRNGMFWWIQSVYVAQAHRRRGVFSSLYAHVAQLARKDGSVCGIRLYVDEHNRAAQNTYRALGFDATEYRIMELELR